VTHKAAKLGYFITSTAANIICSYYIRGFWSDKINCAMT